MAVMTAKYKGRCARCGRWHIFPGDQIESEPAGGWKAKYCAGEKLPARAQPPKTLFPLSTPPRKQTASDKAAAEILSFSTQPRDPLDPGGYEEFY